MSTSKHPFIKQLDEFCKEINYKYPHINYGGCAVFASLLGQKLSQYGLVEIATGDDEIKRKPSIDEARNNVHYNSMPEWERMGVLFGHVVVEFTFEGKTYHVDSLGVCSKRKTTKLNRYPIYPGRLTVEEITELASTPAGWNKLFDRDQIPSLTKMITRWFQHIRPQFFPNVNINISNGE